MDIDDIGSFSDLKQLLIGCTSNQNQPSEIKRRSHTLCSRFLGGAWKSLPIEEMIISRMKGGMSNLLFLCCLPQHHPPEQNEPDRVLLRVYFNPETKQHLVAESVVFTLLSERHLGPKLYGIFSGGRLEEYIPSRPLSCYEISLSAMARKIAKRLAQIHILELPISKEPDFVCDSINSWLRQLAVTSSGAKAFNIIPNGTISSSSLIPERITCAQLADELLLIRRCMANSKSPVVFCHNDLQEGNILLPKASSGNIRMPSIRDEQETKSRSLTAFNPAARRLVLIDFEYASYNYRGFDFANHFCEYAIDYDEECPPFYRLLPCRFPSLEQQRDFFDAYLTETGGQPSGDSLHLDSLIAETRPFVPVAYFFWGIWGLLQVDLSPVDFGFTEYSRDRLALYFATKNDLLSLCSDA